MVIRPHVRRVDQTPTLRRALDLVLLAQRIVTLLQERRRASVMQDTGLWEVEARFPAPHVVLDATPLLGVFAMLVLLTNIPETPLLVAPRVPLRVLLQARLLRAYVQLGTDSLARVLRYLALFVGQGHILLV